MTDALHVLVYGTLDAGACDSLRVGMHRDRLAALDVEVRTWQEALELAGIVGPNAAAVDDPEAILAPFAWADVIVFRRWRSTVPRCTECGLLADTIERLGGHVRPDAGGLVGRALSRVGGTIRTGVAASARRQEPVADRSSSSFRWSCAHRSADNPSWSP